MTDAAAPPAGFRLTGWHVLAIVCGFFAVVIAVDVAFVVVAVRTFPGEVSATPYEDGLAFNRSVAQLRAQERLGWRASAAAAAGAIVLEVRDRTGQPVAGLAVTGELQRPATEAGRRTLAFHETKPGRYVSRPDGLSGAWDLSAHAVGKTGARFNAERRLTWP